MKKTLSGMALVTAMAFAGATAANAATFNFFGASPWGSSVSPTSDPYTTSVDGISLSVQSGTTDGTTRGRLTWNENEGLGVRQNRLDQGVIDGLGLDDMALFQFHQPVVLESIEFGAVDRNDAVSLFRDDGAGYVSYGEYDIEEDGVANTRWGNLVLSTIFSGDFSGSNFGFGASGGNDNYRIRSITVSLADGMSEVPLPASVLLLLSAFGGLALIRRRQTKAAAPATA